MAGHLRSRNGNYYLRLRVPADLPGLIPQPEILKSLRTNDPKTARLSAASLRPKFLEVFTLTRCGFITDQQAREKIATLLQRKVQTQPSVIPPIPSPAAPTLQQVITQYTNDHRSAWTSKTLLEYSSYFRLLQDVLEVENVATLTRDDVRNLRDTLCLLPSNLYKRFPGKTIKEVLALEDITPMSTTTVNKLLTLLGSLMLHCVKEGHRNDNPVEGLKVKKSKRAEEERKAYTAEDLSNMVNALPSPVVSPDKHFIPLIGMYSGMRMGEICGLHLEDIKQVDGVWCFDVNEEGDKRLKNLSSRRIVPIHPQLLKRGLLGHVEKMKTKGELQLWPNLVRREIDGYCHSFGNWFGRFNRKHVTEDPLKSFHSLRHTFADTLKQVGCQESLISELMGHANDSITMGRYGKRYQAKVLLEAVSRLTLA